MKTVAVLGTLDTKGTEHAFIAELIAQRGHKTLLIDVGTSSPPTVTPDITRQQIATAANIDLTTFIARQDRGECITAISQAAPILIAKLVAEGKIHGIISLGGGGGTAIASAVMRSLPFGLPKIIVSTLASGNTAHYIGEKDIIMIPSIADVAGLNRITRTIFTQASAALCGMLEAPTPAPTNDRPLIAASMFGNTTQCVDHARKIIDAAGYETLVFHTTGTGGKTMESLISEGLITGVLDITTTEWADELIGGTLTAGPTRLDATAKANIPAIIVPGCLDMVNFGPRETVPEKFKNRNLYTHNPQVTLMRTSKEECIELGEILARKINTYTAPVTLIIPLKAISIISAKGQPFHDPEADQALFSSIKKNLNPSIPIIELNTTINDPQFAKTCAETLLNHLKTYNKTHNKTHR